MKRARTLACQPKLANGSRRAKVGGVFRRAALPLGWYYVVTLGLPLANGAGQSGTPFVDHALVVLVVPPILIVVACASRKVAQVFASAAPWSLPACFGPSGAKLNQ